MSKDKAPEAAPKKGGKMKKLLVVGVGGTALIGAGAGAGIYLGGGLGEHKAMPQDNYPKLVVRSEKEEAASGEGGEGLLGVVDDDAPRAGDGARHEGGHRTALDRAADEVVPVGVLAHPGHVEPAGSGLARVGDDGAVDDDVNGVERVGVHTTVGQDDSPAGDRRDLSCELLCHTTLVARSSWFMRQARPWDTRERRARESTMTAIANTAPVIMYRSEEDRSSKVKPLAMDWITMMPSSAE